MEDVGVEGGGWRVEGRGCGLFGIACMFIYSRIGFVCM